MFGKMRWIVLAVVLAVAQSASVAAQAQFWDQQDQYNRQQRSRPQSGGLFDWFGGGEHNSRPRDDDYYRPPRQRQYQPQQQPSESSRAPPPKKNGGERRADRAYDLDRGDGRRHGRLACLWPRRCLLRYAGDSRHSEKQT